MLYALSHNKKRQQKNVLSAFCVDSTSFFCYGIVNTKGKHDFCLFKEEYR